MLRRILHSLFLGAAVLTVATCAELFDSGPRVDTISLAGTTRAVLVGGTLQLSVITLDVSGNVLTGRRVTWESDNTDVATVSPTGLVTGVSSGQVNITATSEGSSTSEAIHVGTIPDGAGPVTASAGPGLNEITVRWPGFSSATSYNVYWGTTPDITPQNGTKDSTTSYLGWKHQGVTGNTTYYYVVTAVNDLGESSPSTMVHATASGDLGLDFPCMGTYSIQTSPLKVKLRVLSHFQIVHATASVSGRSIDLVLDPVAYCIRSDINFRGWVGTIPLDGLPIGPLTLAVSATDALSNVAEAAIVVRYHKPPVLTIAAPDDFYVARPTLRVAASCQDDDLKPCTSVSVLVDGGATLATGQTGVDATVSLAAYDGRDLKLVFIARDNEGYGAGGSRRVFVESSTHLSEVASVDGPMLDVQPDRILFLNQSAGGNALTIHDRMSGSDVVIYNQVGHIPQYGFLTPLGAMFLESTGGNAPTMLHEWKAGGTSDFGAASSLVVRGRYGLFLTAAGLIRRDVVGDENTTVSASGTEGDVAANGDVAYRASNQIFLFRDGVSTQLTNDGAGLTNRFPATDGVNVVYYKTTTSVSITAVYDAAGEHLLTPGGASPGTRNYRVANGWVAYPKGGQVWTRSPTGQEVQASFFSGSSELDTVGPNGEIALVTVQGQGFSSVKRRYVAVPNYVTPREIGSGLGTAFFQNGSLFITIGRSLFQVNP